MPRLEYPDLTRCAAQAQGAALRYCARDLEGHDLEISISTDGDVLSVDRSLPWFNARKLCHDVVGRSRYHAVDSQPETAVVDVEVKQLQTLWTLPANRVRAPAHAFGPTHTVALTSSDARLATVLCTFPSTEPQRTPMPHRFEIHVATLKNGDVVSGPAFMNHLVGDWEGRAAAAHWQLRAQFQGVLEYEGGSDVVVGPADGANESETIPVSAPRLVEDGTHLLFEVASSNAPFRRTCDVSTRSWEGSCMP